MTRQHCDNAIDTLCKRWKGIAATIVAVAGAVSLCWGQLAKPAIQAQIDKSIAPIQRSLEYANCLFMAKMTDAEMEKANKMWEQVQQMKGIQNK